MSSLSQYSVFVFCVGLAILSYLLPYHSPLGRDFLVNSFPFAVLCLGIASFFYQNKIQKFSISILTWFALIVFLMIQPIFVEIAFVDALIFPIFCLLVVGLVATVASNIQSKQQFLYRLFIFVYLMAICTFIIQIMQINDKQIFLKGWIFIRDNAIANRFDGNFGQANHAGYAFVLALCGVIYQLHQSFTAKLSPKVWQYRQFYRFMLMIMFALFTVGLALTQSRAGLMMMIAVILVYFISQPLAWGKKLSLSAFGLVAFLVYYLTTSFISSMGNANELGAVSRMAGGGGNRTALSERAMMMFGDNPAWGVGWNNYMGASVEYAQHFKWPEIADHSHNFITMILAEMGIIGALCFLPIVWVLLRAVHFRHSPESAIALAFVVASLLYASVEYPLWYFRYLAIFALFLALIEQRYLIVKLPKFVNYSVFVVMASLVGASIFYTQTYLQLNYLDYNKFVTHKNHEFSDKDITYDGVAYGFSPYQWRLLAMKVPVNGNHLSIKEPLFKKAMGLESSQFNILAYAQILAYKGDVNQAFQLIQASCLMVNKIEFCDNVDIDLGNLAKHNPAVFADLYQQFVAWRQANPEKTGLTTK